MTDARSINGRPRWPRGRGARLLGVALIGLSGLPLSLGAQSEPAACEPSAPWRHPATETVVPEAALWWRDSLLILGGAARSWRDRTRPLAEADSTVAAVLVGRGGGQRPIARPQGALAFVAPRARLTQRGVEVLWSELRAAAEVGSDREYLLKRAVLTGAGWRDLQVVASIPSPIALTREWASELVSARGVSLLAVPTHPSGEPSRPLALFTDSGTGWRRVDLRFGTRGFNSVGLAFSHDKVHLAFAAVLAGNAAPGTTRHARVYLARLVGSTSGAPVDLGSTTEAGTNHVRAFADRSGGVVVAWIEYTPASPLAWRGVGADGTLGPLHRLDGVERPVQAQGGAGDLFSARRADGATQVLLLSRDGVDTVATLPRSPSGPPLIVFDGERPLALMVERTNSETSGPVRLIALDLSCDLRRVRGR